MKSDPNELAKWFTDRPKWLQDAARRLFYASQLTSTDLNQLLILCKREAGITVDEEKELLPLPVPAATFTTTKTTTRLRLDSISEVSGINALAPRKPLEFGAEPLTIIYGANGSGKSGYIRVLKHVCGGRGGRSLLGNVFAPIAEDKSCKISYTLGDAKKDISWTPATGSHKDLQHVALYDTDCANIYIHNESELAYEHSILAGFRRLVEVCEQVDGLLSAEMATKVSAKPNLPTDYFATSSGTWFNQLTRFTTEADINAQCVWSEEQKIQLLALQRRIAEASPAERAKALRKAKAYLIELLSLLKTHQKRVNDDSFASLLMSRADAAAKRQAANIDANKVFENSPLRGIASESWRLLWEKARLYSETEPYLQVPFPNVQDDARCVLCQQQLSVAAKTRMKQFETFVKGSLEADAALAEKGLASILEATTELPSTEALDSMLDLAQIVADDERDRVHTFCELLRRRRDSFCAALRADQLLPLEPSELLAELVLLESTYEAEAKAFEEDATSTNLREPLKKQILALNAQKWVSEQKAAIIADVDRLKVINLFQEARRLANTSTLSTKSGSLADTLVTAAFLERFERELKALGASKIQVTISKTKTTKGQVWHQIKLKNAKQTANTAEILSEGEFRIVSLAAFLADAVTEGVNTSFIFDDPISSLDQDFEELAATRLVKLSTTRQVIVFTHRLSLLAMLESAAEVASVKCRVVSVQRESWGAGEPNEPPLPAQTPKKAINTLLGERLSKAKKVLVEQGNAQYQIEAKAMCSDIRITIERLVEYELLADVVQRFRRPINTQGKLEKLARVKASDCAFIDALMTKYSRYEHAQPGEAPIPLPEPDELSEDLIQMKTWREEFERRVVPV